MALSLATPEGDTVEVTPVEMPDDVKAANDAFHRAQANDPLTDDTRRPPKRQAAETAAPPKRGRGRPRKDDPEASRTTDKKPVDQKKPLEPHDFTAELEVTADMLWMGASAIPVVGPVVAPYALVFHANTPALVQAVNEGAQVNHGVRNFCEKMTSGTGNAWVLGLAVVGVNIGMQCYAAFKDKDYAASLAEANTAEVSKYMNALSGQAGA